MRKLIQPPESLLLGLPIMYCLCAPLRPLQVLLLRVVRHWLQKRPWLLHSQALLLLA